MKLSSAAITVAAISFLSTTHAIPLSFKNGEVSGRLHYRRGSDLSDLSSASKADEAIEDLDIGFEPGATFLPRLLNLFKRQSSSAAAISTSTSSSAEQTADEDTSSGTTDTDPNTGLMTPDYESYGFASEGGMNTALTPVKEVKE